MNIFKKRLIIISIIVFLVVAGIIFIQITDKKIVEEITETRTLSDCEEIMDEYYRNYCYLDLAVLKKNLFICDKITDQDYKENCYSDIAIV